jgi:hypothetical protein
MTNMAEQRERHPQEPAGGPRAAGPCSATDFGTEVKVIGVIEAVRGARAGGEDDPAVRLAHATKDKGSDLHLLLRGEAVVYAARETYAPDTGLSDAPGASLIHYQGGDVVDLIWKGVKIFVIGEDLADRGLAGEDIVGGLSPVSRAELPAFLERFDRVCYF